MTEPRAHPVSVLFTAFEPSGDDHAAPVIAELRRRHPDLAIYAWGGPKMAQAGARIIQPTGDDAVVGIPGWETIRRYLRIRKDITRWMDEHRPTVHIPVDSPGANFTLARSAKKRGLKVVHLVAPQLWAWGPWRIGKLRRCTDLVLCILPFEQAWFEQRGVRTRFIGHPLFDEPLDLDRLDQEARALPTGEHRLIVLPGSRAAELRRNFPVMLAAFRELRRRHPGLVGVVGATTDAVRAQLQAKADLLGGWPEGLDVQVGKTDLLARWGTVAMAVSGTVALQLTKQLRPMVVMYKTNELSWKCAGQFLLRVPFVALPNLIAGREVVTELFPYFKGHERLVEAVDALLCGPERQARQRQGLQGVCAVFAGHLASASAADAIGSVAGLPPAPRSEPRRAVQQSA
ncbi:MAG TPA: hypothetical protein DEB06_01135 [Phycisphaerales bacterium]|nr:hypothetical protein [Phycisphaerales bacterium]